MPDRSLCLGQDCDAVRNCMRCPMSGTVAKHWNQAWFGVIPGGGTDCNFYLPVRDSLDEKHFRDIYHPLWRAVEFFVNWMKTPEFAQLNDMEVFVYVSEAFYHVVGFADPGFTDEICEWFKQGPDATLTCDERVTAHLLAVVSIMDTSLGYPKYVDKLSSLLPQVAHLNSALVAKGNGSVN